MAATKATLRDTNNGLMLRISGQDLLLQFGSHSRGTIKTSNFSIQYLVHVTLTWAYDFIFGLINDTNKSK